METNFNYSMQSRNGDVNAAEILFLSDENTLSHLFTRPGKTKFKFVFLYLRDHIQKVGHCWTVIDAECGWLSI